MTLPYATIRSFWAKFVEVASRLERNLEDETAIRELDAAVAVLGPYGWEIGPGSTREFMFAFSPGNDRLLYAEALGMVAKAPSLARWEILAALPPKEWEGVLMYGDPMDELDTRNWKYILCEYADGKVEIKLFAPDLIRYAEEDRQEIAELSVVSWIGEARLLQCVVSIDVSMEQAPEGRGILFPNMPRQLSEMCKG